MKLLSECTTKEILSMVDEVEKIKIAVSTQK